MKLTARTLHDPRFDVMTLCGLCLLAASAGCGTGDYEDRMNANRNRWGASTAGAGGGFKEYAPIPDFDQYEIRIPSAYSAPVIVEDKPNLRVRWTGDERADGTAPEIQVRLLEPLSGAAAPSLDDATTQQLQTLRDRFDNLNDSPPNSLTIGGIEFRRVIWSARDKADSRDVQGFLYVGVDGDLIVHIEWHDDFDEGNDTKDDAFAAAESFRAA